MIMCFCALRVLSVAWVIHQKDGKESGRDEGSEGDVALELRAEQRQYFSRVMKPEANTTNDASAQPGRGVFATTHWSRVLAAAGAPEEAQAALNELCQQYWYPIYVCVRQRGYSPEDAKDLTQGFFAHFLGRGAFAKADPQKGRLRSFLLGSLRHFLGHEWEKAQAKKRGGTIHILPLDSAAAETRYSSNPPTNASTEATFDREWSLALIERVLNRLQAAYRSENREHLYLALKHLLMGDNPGTPYSSLGAQLGMSEGALKVASHRLRKRYRELLREEIAQTVGESGEIEAEMRHLFAALGGELKNCP